MATSALQKITTDAKRIVKAHPKTKWAAAIKQAGALYRAAKKKAFHKPKKKAVVYKAKATRNPVSGKRMVTIVKSKTVRRQKIGSVRGGGIPGGKETRLSFLYTELSRFETVRQLLKKKKAAVTSKSEKNTIAKTISYYTKIIAQTKRNIELLKKL